VLVQREMESCRSPLASIQPFSAGQFGGERDVVTASGPRQVAEAATGFKKGDQATLAPVHTHHREQAKDGMEPKSIVWCLYLEKWCFKPLRPDCSLDSF
jgi:hypothetical protein